MKKIVLYADDSESMRTSVSFLFNTLPDVELLTFEDGAALLSYLGEHPECAASLIMTDMEMPRCGGLLLAQTLRKDGKNTPILFLSGSFTPEIIAKLSEFRDAAWLGKPFAPNEFLAAIRLFLAR